MRPARSMIGTAALALTMVMALSACDEQDIWSGSARSGERVQVDRYRTAARTIVDRQRGQRRERRDRASRRYGRGSGDLLPHLGDYVVHESGFATARFMRAQGTLTINLTEDCGDWTLQEKWDLELEDQEAQIHKSNLLYRASEHDSQDRFVFAYSRDHLGERTDFIGDVIPVDDGFVASFTEPKDSDLFLTPDTMFPIAHLRQVLAAARRQAGEFEAVVFDGGNRFPYRAVTRIGRMRRADDRSPRVRAARTELDTTTSDQLPEGRNWPVRIDYFPLDDAYARPVLTREFLLHENGIILSFHFDYGDVQMDARLKNLDIHDPPACAN